MKHHTPASEWRRRIEAWKASGQTATEFGARHGIDSRQLYWWSWWQRKRAGKQAPLRGPDKAAAVRFLPVKVSPTPLAAVEVKPRGAELLLARGAVLRIHEGSDPAWAAHLVARVVEESRSC
jgi:hypothetical protein